jgi:hypothetical protein
MIKSGARSRSVSPERKGVEDKPKRFLNGWSKEQERLLAEWSDIAICYRWLHDNSEKFFHKKTLWINLPVIILSTLGGTANFGIQSLFDSDTIKKYASFGIGGISLLAGLLTTIGNYLRYPQLEESHRVASISWGKFQRLIAIELALDPNDRMESLDFLKICRAELDRLIEQSPPIPKKAIVLFEKKFGKIKDLKKPDICGSLEHTHVYESSETRLKQLAVDAALLLKHRKRALSELLAPDIQENIKNQVDIQINTALEKSKIKLKEEIEMKKIEDKKTEEEFEKILEERRQKIKDEIESERKRALSTTVSKLEDRMNYNKFNNQIQQIHEQSKNNIVIIPSSDKSQYNINKDIIEIVTKK